MRNVSHFAKEIISFLLQIFYLASPDESCNSEKKIMKKKVDFSQLVNHITFSTALHNLWKTQPSVQHVLRVFWWKNCTKRAIKQFSLVVVHLIAHSRAKVKTLSVSNSLALEFHTEVRSKERCITFYGGYIVCHKYRGFAEV